MDNNQVSLQIKASPVKEQKSRKSIGLKSRRGILLPPLDFCENAQMVLSQELLLMSHELLFFLNLIQTLMLWLVESMILLNLLWKVLGKGVSGLTVLRSSSLYKPLINLGLLILTSGVINFS